MSELCLGFDIGGTKCAVITGEYSNGEIVLCDKEKMATDKSVSPDVMIERMTSAANRLLDGKKPDKIGVSCGSPLDSGRGVILSPPNLPGWDEVYITEILEKQYGVPASLQNDANACAIAEWKFGAGKGVDDMIFLTFGTGFGAGLILGGRLYEGANGNAGEVGHVRLSESGPVGYNKKGSMEGFCSGGGLAQLGATMAREYIAAGKSPAFYTGCDKDITAKTIADAAHLGDECALEVYRICGERLGLGLSMMIDMFNPSRIVIGSIFTRAEDLLWSHAKKIIDVEALPHSAAVCEVLPAKLGERLGDYAAIAAAFI